MSKCSGIKWGVALLAIALMVFGGVAVLAKTPAGTTIGNQAVAQYTDSGDNTRTATSNIVYVTVKQVAGVSVSPSDPRTVQVVPNQMVHYSFKVENTGNGPDSFSLHLERLKDGDQIDPESLVLYRDVNGNGVIDAGDTQVVGPVGPIAAGNAADLIARFRVPSNANVDATIEIKLSATTNLAGSDASGESAAITFTVISEGLLSATLEAMSDDESDRAQVEPGGKISYTITALNQGMTAVNDGKVIISLPVNTAYNSESLRINGVAPDTDPGDNEFPYTVDLPTVNPGQAIEITYSVTVNADHRPGFVINSATVMFGTHSTVTNQVQTRVVQIAGVTLTQEGLHEELNTEIGKTYSFTYKVTNTGNGIDRIYVGATDDKGWAIALYSVDGVNELPKLGGQYTVGNLDPGGTTTFIVKVTVPTSVGTDPQGENKVTVTAASSHDPSVTDSKVSTLNNFKGAGVTLTAVGADEASGNPGASVDYKVKVKNEGPATDLFELTASSVPSGYVVGFYDDQGNPISNISVAGNGEKIVTVRVTVPSGATPIEPDAEGQSFQVKATSQNNSDVSASLDLKVGVNTVIAIDLAPNRTGSANRNGFTTYIVTLRNLGNDVVDVELEFSVSGTMRLDYMFTSNSSVSRTVNGLEPGASEPIEVRVYVPSETAVGTVETARVTATVAGGGPSDFATLTTTVIGGEMTLKKSTEDTNPAPGELVSYKITAENISVSPLKDVVIFEKIPAYTTFVSASAPAGSTLHYSVDGGSNWMQYNAENPPALEAVTDVKWELANPLAANQSFEVQLTVRVN